MRRDTSEALFEAAQKVMPGGVNSPVRAFKAVGGKPHFIARGRGSRVWDVDGNSFIDYVCSWGPLILGHAHPAVVAAVQKAVEQGTSFGAPTEGEVRFRGLPLSACLREARQKIGLVFQDADTQIIGQTIEDELRFGPENLGLPEEEIRRRVESVIRLLGLEGNLLTPPDRLSGGEKRRLAIGGILTIEPELLILDEPFANLDYPGIVSVLRLLLQLKEKGIGIVLITHEMEKALAHADRLVIMEKGRIVEDGPVQTIAPRAGQYGLHPLDFSQTPLESCTWLPR